MTEIASHRHLGPFRGPLGAVLAVLLVAVLGTAIGLAWWRSQPAQKTLVADFTQTVGIYPGSDVRIMGVKVGTITSVKPHGTTVSVTMTYDAKYRVPASAAAVIIPPSVVSDRYIQLSPAYSGSGAVMRDHARLSGNKAVAPLELDDVYNALNNLSSALGPNGANANGSLNDLLAAGKNNLQGNGKTLHQTLEDLADAMDTLSNGRQDLFGTVVNLQKFTTALAESDSAVREFNQQLADVSEQLASERQDLAAALSSLSVALGQVATFVKDNQAELTDNVNALTDLTGVLVAQQKSIMDVLNVAPTALSNLNLAYNARSGTLDVRDDVLGPYDAASWVCSMLVHLVPAKQIPDTCFQLAEYLYKEGQPITAELKKLLSLLPITGLNLGAIVDPDPAGTTNGTGRVGQTPVAGETSPQSNSSGEVQSNDPTLAGILGGGKS